METLPLTRLSELWHEARDGGRPVMMCACEVELLVEEIVTARHLNVAAVLAHPEDDAGQLPPTESRRLAASD